MMWTTRLRPLALAAIAGPTIACGAASPSPPLPPAVAPRAASTQAPADAASFRVVDAMPTWWAFWREAEGQPRDRQRALFKEHVVEAHPELFRDSVVSIDNTAKLDLDARIDALLDEVTPLVGPMRRISDDIAAELPRHRATFTAAFPDFAWRGQVYFTVSLLAFDGAVREVEGEPALLFGVDKIAKIHRESVALAPLFHHELFHVYHFIGHKPFGNDESNRLYKALWGEGLAVHVAKTLNPHATMTQLVLSDEMVRRGTQAMPALAAELRANLDSGDEVLYRDYFRGSGQRADVPVRVGYFVGMRVAEVLGQRRSLGELARLADPDLRAEIERALIELERGGASK